MNHKSDSKSTIIHREAREPKWKSRAVHKSSLKYFCPKFYLQCHGIVVFSESRFSPCNHHFHQFRQKIHSSVFNQKSNLWFRNSWFEWNFPELYINKLVVDILELEQNLQWCHVCSCIYPILSKLNYIIYTVSMWYLLMLSILSIVWIMHIKTIENKSY